MADSRILMKNILLGACGLMMVTAAGCSYTSMSTKSRVKETRHLTSAHVDGGSVVVNTSNGSIELIADPSVSEVMITAHVTAADQTKSAAQARLAATKISVTRDTSRVLTIQPVFPTKPRGGDGASFVIRMPGADDVNIDTSNGAISVSGFSGKLIADTSNGPVTIDNHDGPAHVDTSNGAITVTNLNGEIWADTSNGPVELKGIAGKAYADTSNGNIVVVLKNDQSGPLTLDTSNGSIKASVGPAFAGTVSFDTSNGRVSVNDPSGRCSQKALKKTSGSIVVGDGGPASRIETSNGNVELTIEGGASASAGR